MVVAEAAVARAIRRQGDRRRSTLGSGTAGVNTVEPGQLHRPGNDRLEHGLHVERRADCAPHLAQRRKLRHRPGELLVQTAELGGCSTLLLVETAELLIHVVQVVRESPEFVAIGHRDAAVEPARRHVAQKALCLPHRKEKGPRDHEAAKPGKEHRDHREHAGQNQ